MTNPLDLTQDLTFKYLFSQCPEELSAFLDSVLHQSTRSLELVSGIRSGSMSYQKAYRDGSVCNLPGRVPGQCRDAAKKEPIRSAAALDLLRQPAADVPGTEGQGV